MGMKRRGLARLTAILAVIVMVIFTGCPKDAEVSETFGEQYYSVTVQAGVNGSISADTPKAEKEYIVTLTISPDEEYSLIESSLSVKRTDGTTVDVTGSGRTRTFTMPASNVTVSGEFEEFVGSPPTNNGITITYTSIHDENIDLTSDPQKDLVLGSNQTLSMQVPLGYDNYDWYVDGKPWIFESNSVVLRMDTDADIWDENTVGVHTITVVVQKGDIFYSNSLTFRVVL
jgi:hypothetical protein